MLEASSFLLITVPILSRLGLGYELNVLNLGYGFVDLKLFGGEACEDICLGDIQ